MVLPLIIAGAEVAGEALAVGEVAAEGAGIAAEEGAVAGAAAKKGGGILSKLIGAEELHEVTKTISSLFGGKKQNDSDDTTPQTTQEQTTGKYSGTSSASADKSFDDYNRKITNQESILQKGFWFGKKNDVDKREVDQAMKSNFVGFVVGKLASIDNKISRLDVHMRGIKKILEDHLVLERERLADQEIASQENLLKQSDKTPWLLNRAKSMGQRVGSSALDTILPFLTVGLFPILKEWYNKFAKWTWAATDRIIAGIMVASRVLAKSLVSLSQWATRTGNTLLGKLNPFRGSVTQISNVSDEERELRDSFDLIFKKSKTEGMTSARARSIARKLTLKMATENPEKYNEAYKRLFPTRQANKSSAIAAEEADTISIKEADSLTTLAAKAAGRASIRLSAKTLKLLSYLVPLKGFLMGIAKYAKFLMFLDPLITFLRLGPGGSTMADVEKSFVRALGAFIGAELGAMGGAAAGAALFGALGSVIPGIGNLIGAAAGGIIGGIVGGFGGASVGEYLAEKIWQIMTGEKTVIQAIEDVAYDALNKAKLAANMITGTTPVSTANLATVAGLNPATSGDTKDTVGGATGSGVGSSANAKKAMNYFMASGYSRIQAAAIVGNLQQESYKDLNPSAVGDGGKAYGIAQWHPDRQADFKRIYHKDIRTSTFEEQLAFVVYELKNGKRKLADRRLLGATDISTASGIVQHLYEGTRTATQQRVNNSQSLVKSETGSSPPYASAKPQNSVTTMAMPMKQTKIAQSQQYGIPSPFASTSYDDRVSVFFNANEPTMGVSM